MSVKIIPPSFSALVKYLFLLFALISCTQFDKQSSNKNKADTLKNFNHVIDVDKNKQDSVLELSNIEDKIIDTIFHLKEIKERQKYIEQQTKNTRHLKIWIEDKPNLKNKYYWIKVGEDNGTNLVTHFNFFVYPDSMRIMFFDTQDDKEISLKEWRKTNGK